jgi:hypothetical protein
MHRDARAKRSPINLLWCNWANVHLHICSFEHPWLPTLFHQRNFARARARVFSWRHTSYSDRQISADCGPSGDSPFAGFASGFAYGRQQAIVLLSRAKKLFVAANTRLSDLSRIRGPLLSIVRTSSRLCRMSEFALQSLDVLSAPMCSARRAPPTHFSARHAAYSVMRCVVTIPSPVSADSSTGCADRSTGRRAKA